MTADRERVALAALRDGAVLAGGNAVQEAAAELRGGPR
jgi:hypothetical protein